MTFKDTDTGKLYNIDLFFEKFTDFSNEVSKENMKRFKEEINILNSYLSETSAHPFGRYLIN